MQILIEIPDVVINDTILKRKARLFTMTYNQNELTLTLTWVIGFYANLGGAYGSSISELVNDYSHQSIADNNTKVNPATGEIIFPITTQTVDSNGHTTEVITYATDHMGQYDWFNHLAETQPIQVHDMIRQYGTMISNWDK